MPQASGAGPWHTDNGRRSVAGPGIAFDPGDPVQLVTEPVGHRQSEHRDSARPHRSLGQITPAQADTHPPEPVNLAEHRIRRKQILGGLTHEYYVAA